MCRAALIFVAARYDLLYHNTWKHSSAQNVGSSRHTGTTGERRSFKAAEPEGLLLLRAAGIGCAVNINNSAHSD